MIEEVGQVLDDISSLLPSESKVRLRGGTAVASGSGSPPDRSSSSAISSSSSMTPKGWAHKKTGRHITNIRSINVVNNFVGGGGGGGGAGGSLTMRMEQRGWLLLRIALTLLLLIWLCALISVTKGAGGSNLLPFISSSPKTNQMKGIPSKEEFVGVPTTKDKLLRNYDAMTESLKALHINNDEEENNQLPFPTATEAANIFELSLFGNQSPNDFQQYTPHAPSCSIPLAAQEVSFTLVSQLSGDRLWMVPYHCERWGPTHPISIAVFTDKPADEVKLALVLKGCSEEQLTVQTVSNTKYDLSGTEYPVNLMRNLAFSAVKTSHVVYADVDFWSSSDLYPILTNTTVQDRLALDSKLAVVIPVFQMIRMCRAYKDCKDDNIPKMPKHKERLLWLISRRGASAFDPTNSGGHGSTKYQTWRQQPTSTFVDLPCIKSNRYEPYLVVRYCSELPPFQEGFTGYGKNKMTWAMHLRKVGYKFTQLGGAFLVHYPHLDSASRIEWNKKPAAIANVASKVARTVLEEKAAEVDLAQFKRARIDSLFIQFKEWLNNNVHDEARTPKCTDAQNDDYSLWVHSSERNKEGSSSSSITSENEEDEKENDNTRENEGDENEELEEEEEERDYENFEYNVEVEEDTSDVDADTSAYAQMTEQDETSVGVDNVSVEED